MTKARATQEFIFPIENSHSNLEMCLVFLSGTADFQVPEEWCSRSAGRKVAKTMSHGEVGYRR